MGQGEVLIQPRPKRGRRQYRQPLREALTVNRRTGNDLFGIHVPIAFRPRPGANGID